MGDLAGFKGLLPIAPTATIVRWSGLDRYGLGAAVGTEGICNLQHGQPLPSTRLREMLVLRAEVSKRCRL